jgi:hypothetical protein
MARPLLIEYPGAVYHITSRGNEKKAVFIDKTDRVRPTKLINFLDKEEKAMIINVSR